ncbi:MAG: helix-turn-helix domain-containing protein [Candidatus Brocadiales bacterium]|nr:helix-turn-helix domain-containing protein [Candidatus Brocadiales bacterium]
MMEEKSQSDNLSLIREQKFKSQQIREIRAKMGLTQEDFAKILGVSAGSVCGWEQGRKTPSLTANRILELLLYAPEAFIEFNQVQKQVYDANLNGDNDFFKDWDRDRLRAFIPACSREVKSVKRQEKRYRRPKTEVLAISLESSVVDEIFQKAEARGLTRQSFARMILMENLSSYP